MCPRKRHEETLKLRQSYGGVVGCDTQQEASYLNGVGMTSGLPIGSQ